MNAHTPEPWILAEDGEYFDVRNDEATLFVFRVKFTAKNEVDEARKIESIKRAVACVNTCAGIPDPVAALAAAREALEAVKRRIMDGEYKPSNYGEGEKRCKATWDLLYRALAALNGHGERMTPAEESNEAAGRG